MPSHPQEHPALVRIVNAFRSSIPPDPPGDGPPRRARRLQVFGAGPDWLQVTWTTLGPGPVTFRCGEHRVETDPDGGPGAVTLTGLDPGTVHDIELSGPGIVGSSIGIRGRTSARPPGELLTRIATVSDVHLGSRTTGYLHTITEIPEPPVTHTVRCLRTAVDEATRWGAEHLVVKGDLVDRSDREHWATAGRVLGDVPIPVSVLPGNHETSKVCEIDAHLGAAEVGLHLVRGHTIVDHRGVRILLFETARPGTDVGRIDSDLAEIVIAGAAGAEGAVFVGLHHQLMRPPVPTYLPPGIPRGQSRRFLDALAEANPRSIVSSGHTHRHRRYEHGPVTVTEVGSTKDFPGTWAGYEFYEGGVVQAVRRMEEPSVIRWTEHTRRAALGIWGLWAPGPFDSRCFSRMW